uniref:Sorting nexin 3 n=1 Tax=Cyprinus carpio carpio TaxID=630221 RepID=A0A9J7YUF0_CYPCA
MRLCPQSTCSFIRLTYSLFHCVFICLDSASSIDLYFYSRLCVCYLRCLLPLQLLLERCHQAVLLFHKHLPLQCPCCSVSTNLPIFKLKESRVRRRYSDFEWLRGELERESKVVVPPLPGKALFRQLPFRGDDGIFDDSFIEERRQGLEQFLNKVAGHPLAQNERCLHMFLQEESVDKNYTPSKIRQA